MNNTEARSLLGNGLHALAGCSFGELVAMIGHADVKNMEGKSGANYQVEINILWDSKPEGDLRIIGSIDDGGWARFCRPPIR